MSQPDPKRLLEDPATSESLRLGLQALHRRAPAPEHLARIVAGLSATGVAVKAGTAQASAVSTTGGATAAKTAPILWKMALLAIVPAGVGLAVALLPTDQERPRPVASLPELSIADPNIAPISDEGPGKSRAAPAAASKAAGEIALPLPHPVQGTAPDEASVSDPASNENAHVPGAARVGMPHNNTAAHNSTAAPSTTHSVETKKHDIAAPALEVPARSEVELLQTASTVLGANPAEALQLCEEHRKAYPSGAMSQEREMIAITALVRLGRQDEAYARAERFRRNYPKSAYLRQIDKVSPPR